MEGVVHSLISIIRGHMPNYRVQFIGALTQANYQQLGEMYPFFERHVQPVIVDN